jgi:hypothetical protein
MPDELVEILRSAVEFASGVVAARRNSRASG